MTGECFQRGRALSHWVLSQLLSTQVFPSQVENVRSDLAILISTWKWGTLGWMQEGSNCSTAGERIGTGIQVPYQAWWLPHPQRILKCGVAGLQEGLWLGSVVVDRKRAGAASSICVSIDSSYDLEKTGPTVQDCFPRLQGSLACPGGCEGELRGCSERGLKTWMQLPILSHLACVACRDSKSASGTSGFLVLCFYSPLNSLNCPYKHSGECCMDIHAHQPNSCSSHPHVSTEGKIWDSVFNRNPGKVTGQGFLPNLELFHQPKRILFSMSPNFKNSAKLGNKCAPLYILSTGHCKWISKNWIAKQQLISDMVYSAL